MHAISITSDVEISPEKKLTELKSLSTDSGKSTLCLSASQSILRRGTKRGIKKVQQMKYSFLEKIYNITGMDVISELAAITINELIVIGGNINKESNPLTASNRSHGNPSVHATFLSL
jgi:hypothetical protein